MGKTPDNFAIMLATGIDRGKYGNPEQWQASARLVTVAEDGAPRNISFGSFMDGTIGYEGHLFEAHLGEANAAAGKLPYWFEPVVETIGSSMRYADVIETGKVAAAVERKMAAMARADGYAATFSEAVLRWAKALGVSRFIVKVSGTSDTYTENQWSILKPAEARAWLDRREEAYRFSKAPSTGTLAVEA